MTFLSMRNVRFEFPGWPAVVRGIDLDVAEGQIKCLVGRSGSGKTTVLKLAAGLLTPSSGAVELRGSAPSSHRRDIGFVFQSPTLLEWQRVTDNVLLPVSLRSTPTVRDRDQADQLLAQLGLGGYGARYPRQLSGGQQSRVALARALILQPALLVLDEPFAALDAITREELQADLLATCRDRGTSALFVTHDIGEAVFLGDEVMLLHDGVIVKREAIALARPRAASVRYAPSFAVHAMALRDAMERASDSPGIGCAAAPVTEPA